MISDHSNGNKDITLLVMTGEIIDLMIDGMMVAMAILVGDTFLNQDETTTVEVTSTNDKAMPIGGKDLKILRIAMIIMKEPMMGLTITNVKKIITTIAFIIQDTTMIDMIIEITMKETGSRGKVVDLAIIHSEKRTVSIIHNEMRTMPAIHSGRIVKETRTITEKMTTIQSKN